MIVLLIRPKYLENLNTLYGETLVNKRDGSRGRLSQVRHFDTHDVKMDTFTIECENGVQQNYQGNPGYRQFMRTWKVAE